MYQKTFLTKKCSKFPCDIPTANFSILAESVMKITLIELKIGA